MTSWFQKRDVALFGGSFLVSSSSVARLCLFVLLLVSVGTGCSRRRVLQSPDDLIKMGWTQYSLGEYRQAVEAFESVRDGCSETDPNHLMALYGLATSWNLRLPSGDQDKKAARALYDRVVALDPESDMAAWSQLAKARMLHLVPVGKEPDYAAVRAAYAGVYAQYPGHYAGHEAFIYNQATVVQTWDRSAVTRAAARMRTFVERHPDSALLSAAYEVLASAYEVLNQPRERMDALVLGLEALILSPDNPTQENSWRYWRIATLAEFEVGDFKTARHFYTRMLEEYPQDVRRYGAEKALQRMEMLEAKLRKAPASGGES
ncbi:MAG: tetratricopeptide repeat protein [Verrucomicrobia bacterium]|nr:tetratricopeptide repeat protein [Verrucomicrobiota bacterium]